MPKTDIYVYLGKHDLDNSKIKKGHTMELNKIKYKVRDSFSGFLEIEPLTNIVYEGDPVNVNFFFNHGLENPTLWTGVTRIEKMDVGFRVSYKWRDKIDTENRRDIAGYEIVS